MKKNLAIVGLQWGDEGKGKIVDILARGYDCVARYQGGHNAGHTVNIGPQRHVLHLVPSGIFHPGALCVIGGGVVLDPLALIEEVEAIEKLGTPTAGRLFVSNRCHVILPYHRVLDSAIEMQLGERRIGTTSRGIGPAYEDKMARRGLRICDLMDTTTLRDKIVERVEEKNRLLAVLRYPQTIDPDPIFDSYSRFAECIRSYVADTTVLVNKLVRDGKSILFEGAQATLLDIDHGTYPYVTSSSAAAGGAATGLGLSPKHVQSVMGITKAYTTRVGGGPFPTECYDTAGDNLRTRGSEYGATTGRPRRCGWFDGPALRYAALVNDPDSIAVTKIDVLDSFDEIPFCTGYKYRGSPLNEFPAEIDVLSKVEPVYKVMPGWKKSIAGVRDWAALPVATQDYLKFLADYVGVPIQMVSTGADREDTIHLS